MAQILPIRFQEHLQVRELREGRRGRGSFLRELETGAVWSMPGESSWLRVGDSSGAAGEWGEDMKVTGITGGL